MPHWTNDDEDGPGDDGPGITDEIIVPISLPPSGSSDYWTTSVEPGTLAYDALSDMFRDAFEQAINDSVNAILDDIAVVVDDGGATLRAEFDSDGDGDTDVTVSFDTNSQTDSENSTVAISLTEGPITGTVTTDGSSTTATVDFTYDF